MTCLAHSCVRSLVCKRHRVAANPLPFQQEAWVRERAEHQSDARSVIMFARVRSLPTIEAEADHRGILRHCRLARRLESSIQHRANATCPGDPPAPEGTCSAPFIVQMGSHSALVERPVHRDEHDQCKGGDRCHEASVPGSVEVSALLDPRRRLLRVEAHGNR